MAREGAGSLAQGTWIASRKAQLMKYLFCGIYLLLLGTRLWPVILIAVLRPVSGWPVAVAALMGTGMFVVGMYSDVLRQIYLVNEYSEAPAVATLRTRLNRLGRLWLGLWLAYALSLGVLLMV